MARDCGGAVPPWDCGGPLSEAAARYLIGRLLGFFFVAGFSECPVYLARDKQKYFSALHVRGCGFDRGLRCELDYLSLSQLFTEPLSCWKPAIPVANSLLMGIW